MSTAKENAPAVNPVASTTGGEGITKPAHNADTEQSNCTLLADAWDKAAESESISLDNPSELYRRAFPTLPLWADPYTEEGQRTTKVYENRVVSEKRWIPLESYPGSENVSAHADVQISQLALHRFPKVLLDFVLPRKQDGKWQFPTYKFDLYPWEAAQLAQILLEAVALTGENDA